MCGIVGYVGSRRAADVILEGLRRLEYRGYDSAGMAVVQDETIGLLRAVGKIENLVAVERESPLHGSVGLGHTRWATHGRPSVANAHPHADCRGSLVVVHNGILENYRELKEQLRAEGHEFRSDTDTEVLAHLVEAELARGRDLLGATREALRKVQGAFAVGVLSASRPGQLMVAKRGAGSVVVGLGEGEAHVASDIPALLPHTRQMVILEDDDVAVVEAGRLAVSTLDGRVVSRPPAHISWDAGMAEKGGYRHFMLKEIFEQPRAVSDTVRGRLSIDTGEVWLPETQLTSEEMAQMRRVVMVACGTSYHAALVARIMFERLTGLPTEAALASEFRYSDVLVGPDSLVVAISQSGETADTVGAVKAARLRHAPVVSITNVVGSAICRESSGVVYTHAGPEIGVASSKTFTATLAAAYLLAVALGRARGHLSEIDGRKRLEDLLEVPRLMEATLKLEPAIAMLAGRLADSANVLYLGRGPHYPVALEGALKLKEISYIHAEGHAAGEMKHGPIALIDDQLPVVALIPKDPTYERMLSNVEEVLARAGRLIAVCHEDDESVRDRAAEVIPVPAAPDLLAPLVSVIPLQLLAYHIAVLRGLDVDQPRNLAKSVTVE
ncbi:MAG TPA: glutamine--fructose-6-phosphate transaminase (isomerizing) [Methylomirabilota bacterium]|nr:glutamine--fructose-6-phosphate transaminase (isomerizing) [Methylomirabilota bacterium]